MKNSKIKKIRAREILDSRGNLTVEVDLITEQGLFRDSVPSGASKGKYEAKILSAKKAVENINKILAQKLKGKNVTKQREIDEFLIKLDGTKDKSRFGANAILPVSMAVCRAGAAARGISLYQYINQITNHKSQITNLPKPLFNVINGGVHAGNNLDFQEFMILPQEGLFLKNLKIGREIYHQLKKELTKKFGKLATNLGDEGGFAPPFRFPEEAIETILKATKSLNYEKKIKILLDVAASQFFENGKYKMKIGVFTREGLLRYYQKLIKNYPILGIEDPFAEGDLESWKMLMSNVKCQRLNFLVIGDDLLATNPKRMKIAKEKEACNGVIIKPNQIGTVTETIEAVKLARSFGWKIIVSHRSGETIDSFISDFAVGVGADFLKAGAPARGERVVKYNKLLKIEEEIK